MPSPHLLHRRHVMTLPSLLVYFLLFLPTLTTAQSNLTLDQAITTPVSVKLAANITVPVTVTDTGPGFLLLDYIPDTNALRESRVLNGVPNLLLSLSNQPHDIPYVTTGTAKQANPEKSLDYACNVTFPCFTQFPLVDAESFYTRSIHASLIYRLEADSQPVTYYATLLNYDRGFTINGTAVQPQIDGQLRISFTSQPPCAGYAGETQQQCLGQGTCTENGCQCDNKFDGRVCEATLYTSKEDLPTVEPTREDAKEPFADGNIIKVEPFQTSYFQWTEPEMSHAGVQFFFRLLEGNKQDVRIMARRVSEKPTNNILDSPPPLPTAFDSGDACSVVDSGGNTSDYFCMIMLTADDDALEQHQVTLAIVANSTLAQRSGGGMVSFINRTCGGPSSDRPSCTVGVFPWIVVPLAVVIISITGLATLIMLWLDRRHGFTNPIDRLTDKELDRMYPRKKFGDANLDQRDTEDECLICLCPFERGELVRQLRCGHMYHSECLDPWLTENNASCPTCRADARLEHLSDKRYLRKIVTAVLWPIALARRIHERRTARQNNAARSTSLDSQQDIETGQHSLVAINTRARESNVTETDARTPFPSQPATGTSHSRQPVTSALQDITTAVEIAGVMENSFPQEEPRVVTSKSNTTTVVEIESALENRPPQAEPRVDEFSVTAEPNATTAVETETENAKSSSQAEPRVDEFSVSAEPNATTAVEIGIEKAKSSSQAEPRVDEFSVTAEPNATTAVETEIENAKSSSQAEPRVDEFSVTAESNATTAVAIEIEKAKSSSQAEPRVEEHSSDAKSTKGYGANG